MATGTRIEGLSTAEAARILAAHGPNAVAERQERPLRHEIVRMLTDPLLLLLIAGAIGSFVLGERVSAAIILVMIVASVTLEATQLSRSQAAITRLRGLVALTATVVRDGHDVEIPRREVVPGDVVRLAVGDLAPADGMLIAGDGLVLDEAALTGESVPVERRPGGDPADALVRMGTIVVGGGGAMRVTETGRDTAFGHIAQRLAEREPDSAFELGIRRFARLMTRVVAIVVVFVLVVDVALDRDPIESLLFAVALAIGLTPEMLPVLLSVTMANGAEHMAREKVIVKHLAAIQSVGSMDVLCCDKTGTLTEGAIELEGGYDAAGAPDATVARWAAGNSAFATGLRSPLDHALLAALPDAAAGLEKLGEVPFDFERRRLSVLVRDVATGTRWLVVKGAPEAVLARSAFVQQGDGAVVAMGPAERRACAAAEDALGRRGLRTLGVALADHGDWEALGPEDEAGLRFLGFVAFLDPPRPDAGAAIAAMAADGVRVMILTGDSEGVSDRVCRDIGVDPGVIARGDAVDRLDDRGLARLAARTTVFARVSPEQKRRIIRALQSDGHVVGFLGDGVNDAPSLRAADVGISVANASDVARESADLILLERKLSTLHAGVVEGRKAFGNVMKAILMGTSSSFGNMTSMAVAAVFLPFLPMLPLQILLTNLLYDLSELAIASDSVDAVHLRKPKQWDIGFIRRFMLTMGPVSSVFDLLTFAALWWFFTANEAEFRTGWFVESLITQTLVVYVIRTSGNPLRSRPGRWLALTTAGAVVVGVAITLSPLRGVFGFTLLPPAIAIFVVVVAMAYLLVAQVAKRVVYRRLEAAMR
jgi:Mg2+-importing ATPase